MAERLEDIIQEEAITAVAEAQDQPASEFVSKVYTVAQDKVFVSATIKIGLRNYSSIELNFGISQNIDQGVNPSEVAENVFNTHILPNVRKFAATLAQNALKIIDIVETVSQKQVRG